MKRKGLFITGTDTDVGKTYITAQIIRQLRANGLAIKVRKPIESGCGLQNKGHLHPADGFTLWQANHQLESLDTVTPYRFAPAIAANRAAALSQQNITTQQLKQACLKNTTENDYLIVEGAGGFYSPLSSNGLNSDLAIHLNLDMVLIVKDRLGCINHTLLTLNAIKQNNLMCIAVILNQCTAKSVAIYNHKIEIQQLIDIPVIGCFVDKPLQDIKELVKR